MGHRELDTTERISTHRDKGKGEKETPTVKMGCPETI